MSDFDWISGLTESEQAKALRDMLADAWDECATEAFERGLLHDAYAEEMVGRNPYRGER